MNYTPIVLFLFGIVGIILHNLIQLNKINRETKGKVNLYSYFKLEIYSILISLVMVGVCVFTSQEIKQLETIGKWLGLAFVSIGYMGQSLLIWFMGKAGKSVGMEDKN